MVIVFVTDELMSAEGLRRSVPCSISPFLWSVGGEGVPRSSFIRLTWLS